MAKLIKKNLGKFFKVFLTDWLEDFFVFVGILLLVITTYIAFGSTAGNYVLGGVFLTLGLLIAKK